MIRLASDLLRHSSCTLLSIQEPILLFNAWLTHVADKGWTDKAFIATSTKDFDTALAANKTSLEEPARITGLTADATSPAPSCALSREHDTRALQAYLGHRNIQHTVRYTELSPTRFKNFWR
jgi:hypothetical protein